MCIEICEAMRDAERGREGRALFMARGTISFLTERKGKGNDRMYVGWDNLKTPVSAFYESL